MRVPAGSLAARIGGVPAGELHVSAITATELRLGPLLSADPAGEAAKLTSALAGVGVIPFDDPAATEHAQLVADFRGAGLAFGAFDSLIVATARLHGLTLVTRDVKMLNVLAAPKAAAHTPPYTDWQTP